MVGKDREKVETGKSQAALDLAKENKQTLDSPTVKQRIGRQGKN